MQRTIPPQAEATRPLTTIGEIRSFFRARGKRVISFGGFGELGYEEDGIVEAIGREVARPWRPEELIVNCGTLLRVGGEDGIARVYPLARMLGIETSGIHPGVALRFADTHPVSPDAKNVFFVDDATWGGFLDGTRVPSPTLAAILEVSDELVLIGGGKHAAEELTAFCDLGKQVRYFPAEMNRRAARGWCERAGIEMADFRGAAFDAWRAVTGAGR